jgi:hypothetical protein
MAGTGICLKEASMTHVTFLQSAFARHAWKQPHAERCDLPLLAGIVIDTMLPVLRRRRQQITVEQPDREVVVRGELRLVFALISAVLLEGAGLSSADAKLRVAFDEDDGDALITVVGMNENRIPASLMRLDRELADLAGEAGAELDLLWDEAEGPTLVLRFGRGSASVIH